MVLITAHNKLPVAIFLDAKSAPVEDYFRIYSIKIGNVKAS